MIERHKLLVAWICYRQKLAHVAIAQPASRAVACDQKR